LVIFKKQNQWDLVTFLPEIGAQFTGGSAVVSAIVLSPEPRALGTHTTGTRGWPSSHCQVGRVGWWRGVTLGQGCSFLLAPVMFCHNLENKSSCSYLRMLVCWRDYQMLHPALSIQLCKNPTYKSKQIRPCSSEPSSNAPLVGSLR
jgi:hypothetical protein